MLQLRCFSYMHWFWIIHWFKISIIRGIPERVHCQFGNFASAKSWSHCKTLVHPACPTLHHVIVFLCILLLLSYSDHQSDHISNTPQFDNSNPYDRSQHQRAVKIGQNPVQETSQQRKRARNASKFSYITIAFVFHTATTAILFDNASCASTQSPRFRMLWSPKTHNDLSGC